MNQFDKLVNDALDNKDELLEKNFWKKAAASALTAALPYTTSFGSDQKIPDIEDITAASHSRIIDDVVQKSKDRVAQSKQYKSTPKTYLLQKAKDTRVKNMTPEEVLARTIYGEAKGESYLGKRAIASVMYNRAGGNPDKLVNVVLSPYQFSVWNHGKIPSKGDDNDSIWQQCLGIASQLTSGQFKPIIKSTHYYNPRIVNPKWAKNAEYASIGRHRFLNAESIDPWDYYLDCFSEG